MKASIFCLPSVGSRAELTELVKLADDLGYDLVSFTEYHFHIEGFDREPGMPNALSHQKLDDR